ncbi:MAG: peroxiredoxin [Myxococcaceae bacterium]
MLKAGDHAPDFTATDCQGNPVSLSGYRGRRVVLFFFPKAFTLGCTIENRAFRDNHALIRSLGAELIGVSVDSVQRQCEFAAQENIRFALIGDESKEIGRAYDVLWPVLDVDQRATFVIDPQGVIENVIHHEVRVYRHLDDVLAWLRERSLPLSAANDPMPS